MPDMTTEKIGYGMGTKQFAALNAVRAFIGETSQNPPGIVGGPNDGICEITCNVDDMTGEAIGFAVEALLSAGAADVFVQTIQMKKNRPGVMITCLCPQERADEFAALMFRHTSTFGVRKSNRERYILERAHSQVATPYGSVRIKVGSGYGVDKFKAEYDDAATAARAAGVTIRDVLRAAEEASSHTIDEH
jgi:uncharacterized protein (DUF111 family)